MDFIREARIVIRIRNADFSAYEGTPIVLDKLRVAFFLQKNLSITPNSGFVRIWNLSSDHRNLIKDFGDEVTIYAGYERGEGLELLYRGDTTAVYHSFDLPDIVTNLECADGYRYVYQKHVPLSFAPQTRVSQVIETIANEMGIEQLPFTLPGDPVYGQGFESTDLLKEALLKACAYGGVQPSVQNNQLQIIPINGTIEEQPFPINVDNGMIGIPQRYTFIRSSFYVAGPAVGWRVATLLKPQILPGARIDLTSRYLGMQGIFRVETVKHSGDTFGPLWESNFELTQVTS